MTEALEAIVNSRKVLGPPARYEREKKQGYEKLMRIVRGERDMKQEVPRIKVSARVR